MLIHNLLFLVRLSLPIIIAFFVFPADLKAEQNEQRIAKEFNTLDANQDTLISFNEYFHKSFKSAQSGYIRKDKNHDGFLHDTEYKRKSEFRTLDKNRDRIVTFKEYWAPEKKKLSIKFKKWDLNGDKHLSFDEYAKIKKNKKKAKKNESFIIRQLDPYSINKF